MSMWVSMSNSSPNLCLIKAMKMANIVRQIKREVTCQPEPALDCSVWNRLSSPASGTSCCADLLVSIPQTAKKCALRTLMMLGLPADREQGQRNLHGNYAATRMTVDRSGLQASLPRVRRCTLRVASVVFPSSAEKCWPPSSLWLTSVWSVWVLDICHRSQVTG